MMVDFQVNQFEDSYNCIVDEIGAFKSTLQNKLQEFKKMKESIM